MKDVRGTKLKISDRVCIQEDIPTVDGMSCSTLTLFPTVRVLPL